MMLLANLKKYDPFFVANLLKLRQESKNFFCIGVIERQKYLVNMFDQIYKEGMLIFFENTLNNGFEILLHRKTATEINEIINSIEVKIPDTEEYGEIEGSYAQNALISLTYFFNYYRSRQDKDFCYAIEKVLESIDLINYEKNENYSESNVLIGEIKIYKSLIGMLENEDLSRQLIADVRKWSNEYQIVP